MKPKRYSSANGERLRRLVKQLNDAKLLPHGYSNQLAEKLNITLTAARETLKGRAAYTVIVEQIAQDAERLLKLRPSRPKRIDTSNLSVAEILEQRLLPNGFSLEVAKMKGLSESTVRQITSGLGTSKNVEEALRQLASRNREGELVHRLECILDAIQNPNASSEN